MYLDYQRNHKRVTYSGLLLSDKLKEHIEHIENIDRQAKDMSSQLVEQMKQPEGVTEQLKATNQMRWVSLMNNIRTRAEEIVMSEMLLT